MKSILYITGLFIATLMVGCHSHEDGHGHEHEDNMAEEVHHAEEVHLTNEQVQTLDLQIDSLKLRSLSGFVEANGRLEVPPQNEASVTATLGGNITSIKVIEGDEVRKGQVLATMQHPTLVALQSSYIKNWNKLTYLKEEYERQKRLYETEVGSGKNYQQTLSEYQAIKAEVSGLEMQLDQIGLSPQRLRKGEINQQIPIKSPIDGFVESVDVKIGQYVDANNELFSLVNTHHIHADIMVFEKDIRLVEEGQQVIFTVETLPNTELTAEIYSVGKTFEQNPKAVHVHAEIENKAGKLIPGMYIKARILVNENKVPSLPEEGVFMEGDQEFLFVAKQEDNQWSFKPIRVKTGMSHIGWVEIMPLEKLDSNALIAHRGAYYLISELKKSEAEHSH